LIPDKSAKNAAKITGTKAYEESEQNCAGKLSGYHCIQGIGAPAKAVEGTPLRSKVMVTASIEGGAEQYTHGHQSRKAFPGYQIDSCLRRSGSSASESRNSGKMMPQLIFGGLR
jgi:hypothetical protein